MRQVWHADEHGWWAQCEPAHSGDSPSIVHVTNQGELRLDDGPSMPLLTWQVDGKLHATSSCTAVRDAQVVPVMGKTEGATLVLLLAAASTQVELRVSCFPSIGVVQVAGRIIAGEQLTDLTQCNWQWAIPFKDDANEQPVQIHRIQGVRLADQSSFPVSFLQVNQPLRRGPLAWGADHAQVAAHPTSSNMWLPWLAAIDRHGVGAAFGFQWSGLWSARVEWVQGYALVSLGSVFTCTVKAGDVIELPSSFMACTKSGLPTAAHHIHAFARTTMPAQCSEDTMPWVQFNSWYPWRAKLNDDEMEKQLAFAAQMGFEAFVLDDGWFRGGYAGAPWGAGAGLWVEDPAKFPAGIKSFGAKVHANGLKFGLWIEPERVDTRVLPESGIEISWLAGSESNEPWAPHKSGSGQQLCFGCPETVQWAKRQLDRLVGEYGADWIKWDHNRYQVCRRSDHGHQSEDGNRAHILGVYDTLSYLRERYPHVVVENCAAGGTRVDYGLMQYTDLTWLHDIPSPSYRARSQFTGAALAFPPEYLNAWVIPDSWEPFTEESARFKLRSCMLGAFGISFPLYDLSPEMQSIVQDEISIYKRLRPLIKHGMHTALLPQPTSLAAWSAHAYILGEAERQASGDALCGAVLAFRGNQQSGCCHMLQIPGLAADARYRVVDQDSGKEWIASGHELANVGFNITLSKPDSSALLWIMR